MNMPYKCRVCGTNDVEHPGDMCELCSIEQDPYVAAMQGNSIGNGNVAQGIFQCNSQPDIDTYIPRQRKMRKVLIGGAESIANMNPYGNSMTTQSVQNKSVQVYQAGQVPTHQNGSQASTANTNGSISQNNITVNANSPLTSGITKNIIIDTQKKSALGRLFRTLFNGIPFTLDNDITMFQVFPDYSGTSLNAMGNACDQVIVYGKLNAGAVAENNDVEVYGHRDSDNNIVAKRIVNKACGTIAVPDRVIPVAVIWMIAIAFFALMGLFIGAYGLEGIIWAVILLVCLMNLPFIFKMIAAIFGIVFSLTRRK